MPSEKRMLNQMSVDEVERDAKEARENPEKCSVTRKLEADWVGGTRSRIHSGNKELFIGGDQDYGAMSVALASLLGCEIDLIATQATVRGIELDKLSIEGTGDFNFARYVGGINSGPSSGYDNVRYTIRIKSKNATEGQLRDLVKLCETSSPVGDTFSRAVHLSMNVVIEK
ncbi:MAG TPA: OsmC family protein [Nitrososphaerales archaeon]|nr:OsmC family protein [Nitrososphaerales archaeon]